MPVRLVDICRMMRAAAVIVRQQQRRLSELDSVAGDGDHGATMVRVMDCLEHVFSEDPAIDLKQSFYRAGWDVMGADGGAATALLGSFFLGISDGLTEGCTSLDCRSVAGAFQSGLKAIQQQTKAQPGDKTMLDALVPATAALREAAQNGADISEVFQVAAKAAESGAVATRNMTARYGRARLLGEKTLGHQDAGATSVALMFEGFAQGLNAQRGGSHNG